jgi:hypothetical protein
VSCLSDLTTEYALAGESDLDDAGLSSELEQDSPARATNSNTRMAEHLVMPL